MEVFLTFVKFQRFILKLKQNNEGSFNSVKFQRFMVKHSKFFKLQ